MSCRTSLEVWHGRRPAARMSGWSSMRRARRARRWHRTSARRSRQRRSSPRVGPVLRGRPSARCAQFRWVASGGGASRVGLWSAGSAIASRHTPTGRRRPPSKAPRAPPTTRPLLREGGVSRAGARTVASGQATRRTGNRRTHRTGAAPRPMTGSAAWCTICGTQCPGPPPAMGLSSRRKRSRGALPPLCRKWVSLRARLL